MRQAALLKKKLREVKIPCVHFETHGNCKRGDECKFAHIKQGICEFFKAHGKCRHGSSCKYQHVNPKFAQDNQDPAFFAGTSNSSVLLKKLLVNEVTSQQNKLLQAIRYIVDNNFFQSDEEPLAEQDLDAIHTDSDKSHCSSDDDLSSDDD